LAAGFPEDHGETPREEILRRAKRAGFAESSIKTEFTRLDSAAATDDQGRILWRLWNQPTAGREKQSIADFTRQYLTEHGETPMVELAKTAAEATAFSHLTCRYQIRKMPGVHARRIHGTAYISLAASRREAPPPSVYASRPYPQPKPQMNLMILDWLKEFFAGGREVAGPDLFAAAEAEKGWTPGQVRLSGRQHLDIIRIRYDPEDGKSLWSLR
jgi:hypothetical protein